MAHNFICCDKKDRLSGLLMHTYQHYSGLSVTHLPKSGYAGKFIAFLVPYGSSHRRFKTEDGQRIQVPEGSANYLKHCIYHQRLDNGEQLTNHLASLGVEAHAYTTYDHTLFYFTAVEHYLDAFHAYLKAILEPRLSPELVERERHFLHVEQMEKQSTPYFKLYDRLMHNLFLSNDYATDPLGDQEHLSEIQLAHLEAIHRHFYILPQLTIVLCGDFREQRVQEILEHLDSCLASDTQIPKTEILRDLEPPKPRCYAAQMSRTGSYQGFMLAYKDPGVNADSRSGGANLMMRRVAGQLFLDTLIGPSTTLYESLYEKGVIDETFYARYVREKDSSYVLIGGDSPQPAVAAETVQSVIQSTFKEKQFDEILFNLQKKVVTGQFIRSLDQIKSTGMTAALCQLYSIDLFDYAASFSRIDIQDTIQHMKFMFAPDAVTRVIMI